MNKDKIVRKRNFEMQFGGVKIKQNRGNEGAKWKTKCEQLVEKRALVG